MEKKMEIEREKGMEIICKNEKGDVVDFLNKPYIVKGNSAFFYSATLRVAAYDKMFQPQLKLKIF